MTAPTNPQDPWDVSSVGAMPTATTPTGNGDAPKIEEVELDNLGFLNLSDVSVGITPGSHKGKITGAKVVLNVKKDAAGNETNAKAMKLNLTYQTEGGDSISEFKNLGVLVMPDGSRQPDMTHNAKAGKPQHEVDRKWLKSRLMNLGVAEADVDRIKPQQLIGTPVILTVSQQGQYMNVSFVKIDDDARAIGATVGAPGTGAPNPAPTGLNF
jgi:hypothetical protein